MSLLNSKFDVITQDNPMAPGALAYTLEVKTPPSPSIDVNGTPVAGTIAPGAVVTFDSTGKAALASTPDISAADKVMPFVTLDGNKDFSGRWVQKLTCLHGGFTMITDQYDLADGAFVKGAPVTFKSGKIVALTDRTKQQVYGVVGPKGLDATEGVLEVIVPQGL